LSVEPFGTRCNWRNPAKG